MSASTRIVLAAVPSVPGVPVASGHAPDGRTAGRPYGRTAVRTGRPYGRDGPTDGPRAAAGPLPAVLELGREAAVVNAADGVELGRGERGQGGGRGVLPGLLGAAGAGDDRAHP